MLRTALALLLEVLWLLRSTLQSRSQLAAENLFLRKQLLLRRTSDSAEAPRERTRITLALLSRVVAWRELLTIVRPDTLVRWHRDRCIIDERDGRWQLIVRHGCNIMLAERCRTDDAALSRAREIWQSLVAEGWTKLRH